MPLQIQLTDADLQFLNNPARQELQRELLQHANDILREASRLEANIRTTKGNPEITSSHIRDASTVISRRYINPRKRWWFYLAKIVAISGALITGFLFERLNEPWGPIAFSLAVVTTAILTTVQTINE